MFRQLQFDTPAIDKIRTRFEEVADFQSLYFEPESPTWSPRFDRGHFAILFEFLESKCLREALPKFFPLNREALRRYSLMNKYEVEGSLIGLLLQGTCTTTIVKDENEARAIVPHLISEASCNSVNVTAYRIDDPKWSQFTSNATITSTYCVYNADKRLWWFFSFSDFY